MWWNGAGWKNDQRFVRFAIIYRLEAGNDETRKTHTCLVIIKLDRERSAVIGHAEGANDESDAHRIADAAFQDAGSKR